jgi:hypothetical protein
LYNDCEKVKKERIKKICKTGFWYENINVKCEQSLLKYEKSGRVKVLKYG